MTEQTHNTLLDTLQPPPAEPDLARRIQLQAAKTPQSTPQSTPQPKPHRFGNVGLLLPLALAASLAVIVFTVMITPTEPGYTELALDAYQLPSEEALDEAYWEEVLYTL